MSSQLTELLVRSYRPQTAFRHVAALSQYHRIQASPGYRAAAAYVAEQLASAGLAVTTHRYPADPAVSFWALPGFLEWSCQAATLHLLAGRGQPDELLCDGPAEPISVIQRSVPVRGEFEVVASGGKGGVAAADYANLDVAGKLLLTASAAGQVLEAGVHRRGAAGVLFDGMAAGGRSALDLPDARQYTSFWWRGGAQPDGWGFVLSPRQGQRLRGLLADGRSVRVRASIDSRFYVGGIEVVDAAIPGQGSQEVLLVSHLCHPLPGAGDNASGAAALIEAAATLARLISDGQLAAPLRGIRFLWVPEMTGTYAWLAEHEADVQAGRWIAGLNLDMVGASQDVTGSTWELTGLPAAGASFADHLLSWLREPFLEGQRHVDAPFGAGSDHYILSDPSVGIPTPMLGQWPDRFYHSSADTLDKVSPDSLGPSGALAAVYAYWLASAGAAEVRWLGRWMIERYAGQAGRRAAAAAETVRTAKDPVACRRTRAGFSRKNEFEAQRMVAALETLPRLAPEAAHELPELRDEVRAVARRAAGWVRGDGGAPAPEVAQPGRNSQRVASPEAGMIPTRRLPGPIDVDAVAHALSPAVREAYTRLIADSELDTHTITALLQYWVDGKRDVAEIGELVSIESGQALGDFAVRYFQVLAATGLVRLQPPGD